MTQGVKGQWRDGTRRKRYVKELLAQVTHRRRRKINSPVGLTSPAILVCTYATAIAQAIARTTICSWIDFISPASFNKKLLKSFMAKVFRSSKFYYKL